MIMSIIRKHSVTSKTGIQDLIQAGYIGISKAEKAFDSTRGVPFKLWVFRFIRSEIIKERYRKNKEWIEDAQPNEWFKNFDISNTENENYNDDKRMYKLRFLKRILYGNHKILKQDNNLNRKIFCDKYLRNYSNDKLAEKYGITKAAIGRRLSKVIKFIRHKW